MIEEETIRHYREITFLQNKSRLKMLQEFRYLALKYFENSTFNYSSGEYGENSEAKEARAGINRILVRAYAFIRLADIKTAATSSPSLMFGGQGKNIDMILNIFNIGSHDIPSTVVIDYIDKAIDVYKSNSLSSFIRSINPFFWVKVICGNFGQSKKKVEKPKLRTGAPAAERCDSPDDKANPG